MSGADKPIDRVIAALRANPIDFAGDVAELRTSSWSGFVPSDHPDYALELAVLQV